MTALVVATWLLWPAPPASPATAGTLKYVVIVARHGIRAPTWTNHRLNEYTVVPWPGFHVQPGNLTPRGRSLTKLMGGYFAAWLSSEGLIRRTSCQDANRIFIWADTDQRTLETGRAIAEGLMPACTIAVHSLREGEADPLFDPIASGDIKPDAERAAAALRERFGSPGTLIAPLRSTFQELQRVMGQPTRASEILTDPSSDVGVTITKGAVELTGPLDIASTFTENLLLEYANGIKGKDLGWGRLDADSLLRIMRLHTTYADLMRRTPLLARARSSNLLAHVLRSMEQAVGGTHAKSAVGEVGDRVLFLSGHDTNLSNLSGMLDLSWQLPGYQRDDTPPGGALVVALRQDATSKEYFVDLQYVAQTLQQMRRQTPLTLTSPPAHERLVLRGCGTVAQPRCPWNTFERIVEGAIDPAFTLASNDPPERAPQVRR